MARGQYARRMERKKPNSKRGHESDSDMVDALELPNTGRRPSSEHPGFVAFLMDMDSERIRSDGITLPPQRPKEGSLNLGGNINMTTTGVKTCGFLAARDTRHVAQPRRETIELSSTSHG